MPGGIPRPDQAWRYLHQHFGVGEVCCSKEAEQLPVYVSETAEQTPEHSSTTVVELSHSVIVPSALQTAPDPVHGGKQDDHHEGGVGAEISAHVRLSSID